MIEITVEDVISGLTSLVEERGEDYTYEMWFEVSPSWGKRCTYVKDGEGDCGVGAYLINKGVPADRLVKFDQDRYANGASEVLRQLEVEGVLTYENGADSILDQFQRKQDAGHTWGESLRSAKWYV